MSTLRAQAELTRSSNPLSSILKLTPPSLSSCFSASYRTKDRSSRFLNPSKGSSRREPSPSSLGTMGKKSRCETFLSGSSSLPRPRNHCVGQQQLDERSSLCSKPTSSLFAGQGEIGSRPRRSRATGLSLVRSFVPLFACSLSLPLISS